MLVQVGDAKVSVCERESERDGERAHFRHDGSGRRLLPHPHPLIRRPRTADPSLTLSAHISLASPRYMLMYTLTLDLV